MAEILVVGAGPVGLTMAIALARQGLTCRIIDRLDTPSPYCRAIGVTPRTLEVWDDLGIVRPMIDGGIWLRGLRMVVNRQVAQEVTGGLPDLPYGLNLGLPQNVTERILTAHLATLGIRIERGTTLTSLAQDKDAVQVTLERNGQSETARFAYVVGCDGAHSSVRKALGIGFPGEAYPVEFMLGDVRLTTDLPRGVALRAVGFGEEGMTGFLVAIPLPEAQRYRLSMFAPDDLAPPPAGDGVAHGIQSERPAPGLERLQAEVDAVLPGLVLSDLRWSSIYRISMRLAERYQSGRVFIAGDAAHIHPPTGGQGMNTGIQDAYNLAWKLALVMGGAAPPELLDSYEAERRPVGEDVLARTIAETEAFRTGARGGESKLQGAQLAISYRDSAWVRDEASTAMADGPQAGDRAPDANGLAQAEVGYPLRLFDLLRGAGHVLLLRLDDAGDAETAVSLAATLAARHGDLLRCYALAPAGQVLDEMPGLPLLADAAGEFQRRYGGSGRAGWLVRPDGYLGYRTGDWRDSGLPAWLERVLPAAAGRRSPPP
ncbi:FAD-dependent monooxygenase [Geminicoccus flavidas]|uniref:FAD-dependent monooxygenase n=1 Tax=Geminicoccus flavidas TaxID=2506407 RepID=UPI0013568721|nr:FAD-dependent monooxygenase [Geminicoccus flavidas]